MCKAAWPLHAGRLKHFSQNNLQRFPHQCGRRFPCTVQGSESKGPFSFAKENGPFGTPREREGRAPRPPTLAVSISKNCSACGIRCGVHGFAMNSYCSLPLATAPYYREARVTFPRRQTACRMRHCCTRCIEECSGRRKLGCTPTRWAERQRIIEANQIV